MRDGLTGTTEDAPMDDTTATVRIVFDEAEAEAVGETLAAEGWYRQDGDGLSILGTYIGPVYAKFDPGNVAYDFVIVSIVGQ
jgi:hypothetical protein